LSISDSFGFSIVKRGETLYATFISATRGIPMEETMHDHLSRLTAEIVTAYVSHHSVPRDDLPKLIGDIHVALRRAPEAAASHNPPPPEPAVPVKKSVTADYVVCLEDGKKFKSLKRHLAGVHGLTPDEYRGKWGLPRNYPMTAPKYSEARSTLAKSLGLGRKASAIPDDTSENESSEQKVSEARKRPERKAARTARKNPKKKAKASRPRKNPEKKTTVSKPRKKLSRSKAMSRG